MTMTMTTHSETELLSLVSSALVGLVLDMEDAVDAPGIS